MPADYNLLVIAEQLNRTLVLPPFQVAFTDFSPLMHVDLLKDGCWTQVDTN